MTIVVDWDLKNQTNQFLGSESGFQFYWKQLELIFFHLSKLSHFFVKMKVKPVLKATPVQSSYLS